MLAGCQNRVPASSEHGFCEQHEIIAVQLYRDLLEDEPTDSPGYEELDDEEQGRIELYLRKMGYPIDTPLNLGAPSVAQAEPQEPVLVPCPYCIPGTMHYKYQLDLCPNNPYRVK